MGQKGLEEVGKLTGSKTVPHMAGQTLRVAVLVASVTNVYPSKFVECLANLVAHFQQAEFNGKHTIKVFTTHGGILPEVRHRLIGDALAWEATHCLMLSPELTFPEDSLQRMLNRGRGTLGVNFLKDYSAKQFAAYREGNNTVIPDPLGPETEEVDGVALGMVLFNMPIFDVLDIPFFEHKQIGKTPGFTEDHIHFWNSCKEHKIPCVIDHKLSQEVKSLHHGELWH